VSTIRSCSVPNGQLSAMAFQHNRFCRESTKSGISATRDIIFGVAMNLVSERISEKDGTQA